MSKIRKTLKYTAALATVLATAPLTALAQDVNLQDIGGDYGDLATGITVQSTLRFVINGILIVAGVIAFLFLLWGGVQWILAGGDKEGTEKARKRITNALIGLAVVFSAYAIALLVNAIFGVNILQFDIPKIIS